MQKDNKTVQNSIARKIWIKLDTFKKIMMYARRLFKLAPIRSKHAVDINFTIPACISGPSYNTIAEQMSVY